MMYLMSKQPGSIGSRSATAPSPDDPSVGIGGEVRRELVLLAPAETGCDDRFDGRCRYLHLAGGQSDM